MDIKVKGITKEIMSRAVKLAQNGIGQILDIMAQTLEKPREILSPYAPRIWTIKIRPEKIREVIGPGGKVIKSIVEQTGVKIDIEDSGHREDRLPGRGFGEQGHRDHQGHYQGGRGRHHLHGRSSRGSSISAPSSRSLPGVDGLVHVSQLSDTYIKKVSDVVKEGDEIPVKVMEVEPNGRIRLSRKAALKRRAGKNRINVPKDSAR